MVTLEWDIVLYVNIFAHMQNKLEMDIVVIWTGVFWNLLVMKQK